MPIISPSSRIGKAGHTNAEMAHGVNIGCSNVATTDIFLTRRLAIVRESMGARAMRCFAPALLASVCMRTLNVKPGRNLPVKRGSRSESDQVPMNCGVLITRQLPQRKVLSPNTNPQEVNSKELNDLIRRTNSNIMRVPKYPFKRLCNNLRAKNGFVDDHRRADRKDTTLAAMIAATADCVSTWFE
jgi:hypothetical protein